MFKGDHPEFVCEMCNNAVYEGVCGPVCPNCAEMMGAGDVEAPVSVPAPEGYWPNFYTESLGMRYPSRMENCPGCGDLFTTLEVSPGMFVGQCGVCQADVTVQ